MSSGARPVADAARLAGILPAVNRSTLNFLVDVLLLLSLTGPLVTGGVLFFAFPGAESARGWTLLSVGYGGWLRLHLALLAWFALVVLLHVILHWTWVCGFLAARFRRGVHRGKIADESARTLYGVAFLIFMLTVMCAAVGAAILAVQSPVAPRA